MVNNLKVYLFTLSRCAKSVLRSTYGDNFALKMRHRAQFHQPVRAYCKCTCAKNAIQFHHLNSGSEKKIEVMPNSFLGVS